jgi:hypothetical protein
MMRALLASLAGHRSPACLAVLDAVLAERAAERSPPELVWTDPDAPSGTARDTAVVLRELFEGAGEPVILAGYSFDHAPEVLAPLQETMQQHQVAAHFFVQVPQVGRGVDPDAHLRTSLDGFVRSRWPFGEPRPRLDDDRRALVPGPPWSSPHAKCVVVDGRSAFVSSANFILRGQERNTEVGVLVEDASLASFRAGRAARARLGRDRVGVRAVAEAGAVEVVRHMHMDRSRPYADPAGMGLVQGA